MNTQWRHSGIMVVFKKLFVGSKCEIYIRTTNRSRMEEREVQRSYVASSRFAEPEGRPSAAFDIVILLLEYDAA